MEREEREKGKEERHEGRERGLGSKTGRMIGGGQKETE